jgi:hypothetical protein
MSSQVMAVSMVNFTDEKGQKADRKKTVKEK